MKVTAWQVAQDTVLRQHIGTFPSPCFHLWFLHTPFPTQHTHTLEGAREHTHPETSLQLGHWSETESHSHARVRPGFSQDPPSRRTTPIRPRPEVQDRQLLPLRPGLPPGSRGWARAGAEAAGQAGAGLTAQAASCSPAMCRSAAVNSWLAGCLGSPSGAPREPGAEPPPAPSEAELRVELGCCRKPSARGGGLPSAALASAGNPLAAMAPPRWEA